MLAQIENSYFKGVDLTKASLLEDNERKAFKLAQAERLLATKQGSASWARLISYLFWKGDEGKTSYSPPHPLMTLEGQQTLTDEEMGRLRLIVEIVGLCYNLSLHYTFDLKETIGIKNVFWVSNKQLVEWLTTTENEHIAAHIAYTMKRHAINVYAYGHYQPAQDELAELFSSEYEVLIRDPECTKIPPRDYVRIILDALLQIERHWQRGRRLKLRPDLVMLHDEIYGVVPHQFDKVVLKAAQELYDYMDTELKGRLVLKDYNYNAFSWSEQPESVRRITADTLNRFAEKVREVRSKYLAKGWIEDNSLEFTYLMSHAERCGYGFWREEDDAL